MIFSLKECLYFERVSSECAIKTTQRRLSGGLYEIPAGVILVHVLFVEKSTPKSLAGTNNNYSYSHFCPQIARHLFVS